MHKEVPGTPLMVIVTLNAVLYIIFYIFLDIFFHEVMKYSNLQELLA